MGQVGQRGAGTLLDDFIRGMSAHAAEDDIESAITDKTNAVDVVVESQDANEPS